MSPYVFGGTAKTSSKRGVSSVNILQVRGEVHHDRRLHQLMLQEDLKAWDRLQASSQPEPASDSEDDGPSSIDSRPTASPADSASSLHDFVSNKTDNAISFYRFGSAKPPSATGSVDRQMNKVVPQSSLCLNAGWLPVTLATKVRIGLQILGSRTSHEMASGALQQILTDL